MKTYLKRLILLIPVIFLTSCASGLKYGEFITTLPDLNPDTGRIYFYRVNPIPLLLAPDVMLNGEKIGAAVPMGFFYVDRPPGSYVITISTEVDRKLSLALEANQTRYVRLKVGIGFFVNRIIPMMEEENEALRYIEGLNYSQGPGYCKSECTSDYDSCIDSIKFTDDVPSKEKECEDRKKTCDNKCSD